MIIFMSMIHRHKTTGKQHNVQLRNYYTGQKIKWATMFMEP
jgi:hypothetical protein